MARAAAPAATDLFVVLGATGDLMQRKLLPALYRVANDPAGRVGIELLGVARRAMPESEYRRFAHGALRDAKVDSAQAIRRWVEKSVFYHSLGEGDSAAYQALGHRIDLLETGRDLSGNRVFYLAVPLAGLEAAIRGLGRAQLNASTGWTRLVVEKPFGHDYRSSVALNQLIHQYFDETQVFRIDHYLGKETVQNLLVFRFANVLFESIWNRDRVDHVEITVAEQLGVENRASYYDESGALRDMMQNHLTQLLTIMAMEVPAVFEAEAIRNEKVKVLKSIPPPSASDVVFGQYAAGRVGRYQVPGYREEPGVSSRSRTETFVAVRLEIENWRWHGVPFYLRTGKRMPKRVTEIVVTFRTPPVSIFDSARAEAIRPNRLRITVQPDEGFDLEFEVKSPGRAIAIQPHSMHFRYAEAFAPLPDAYQTLLVDIVRGDQTLFVRADEAEEAWRVYTPTLEHPPTVHRYPVGTWGPREANRLLDGHAADWSPL
jgi:glucose-6-phosphate 1-dehydrogenase